MKTFEKTEMFDPDGYSPAAAANTLPAGVRCVRPGRAGSGRLQTAIVRQVSATKRGESWCDQKGAMNKAS